MEYDSELKKLDNDDKKDLIKSIDVKKSEKNDYKYVNVEGDSKQYLPKELSEDTPVVMTKDDYVLSFTPTDTEDKAEESTDNNALSGNTNRVSLESQETENIYEDNNTEKKKVLASYSDKTENLDLCYESLSHGVKETITLNEKPESNIFEFSMTLQDMYAKAVYPVSIDPSITWNGTTNLPEAYVLKSSSKTNYFSSGVKTFSVGKGSQGVFRTYMRAKELQKTVNGKYIDSATLTVYENGANVSGVKVNIKPVSASFKCTTVTWANQPGGTSATLASFKSKGTSGAKHEINMKTWAQNVAKGSGDGSKNYGLLFRADNESSSSYVKFYGARTDATSKKPTLKVVYYAGPTTASSVSAVSSANNGRAYLKSNESLKVSWSGISSHALNYVQYRIENAAGKDVVKFSNNTKLGTTASGTKTISVSSLAEGKYKIYVRGVDKGGISGTGKAATFYIDKTAPVIMSLSLDPAYSNGQYSDEEPELSWNVKESYFSCIQVSVNNGAYTTISTENNDCEDITGLVSGKVNLIHVRAVDKAGNISAYSGYQYPYDCDEPVITMSIRPDTNENKYDNSSDKPTLTYSISDSTLKSYSLFINDEEHKLTSSKGTVKLNDVEEGENSIIVSAMDKAENESEEEIIYYRDVTNPETGIVRVTPKTGFFNTSNSLPTITWKGFEDDNLSEMQVKIDDGNYRTLGLTSNGEAMLQGSSFPKDGKYKITVRGVDKAGNCSDEVSYNYYYETADYELDDYTPVNVYATEQIGGNTVLRFSTKNGKFRDDVKYQVYRSTTPNVVINEKTFVKSYASKGSIKVSGDEGVTYYYKLRTVKKTSAGNQYSDYSEEISSTTLPRDTVERRLGENSLNEYMSFDTPNGTGKVELSRGNFIYSQDDISLPAPQIPINISRTYNSKSDEISSMGYGWKQAYDMYVSESEDKVYYVDETNSLYLFEKKDGKYVCNENTEITLEIDDDILSKNIEKNDKVIKTLELDVYYKISDKDDNIYRFDDCGRLVLMEESNGTFVYIEYNDKNGKINSVNTSKGQVAEYSYNENGFISKITAAPDSSQSYSYEYQYENNKLIKATFVGTNGNKIEYKYVYNNDNRLSDVIDAMGNMYSINYDGEYISKFSYPNGEYSAFTFTKNQKQSQPVTRIKTFSDNKEVCSEEYNFTVDGRITYKKDALGNISSYFYDSINKSLLTKATGSESYYTLEGDTVVQKSIVNTENTQYDTHGNVVKSTDIDGNVTEYTYDYSDSLTGAVKNQPKTTKIIDPNGNIIENNLNEYDKFGNVIKEVDYIKNTVTLYTYGEDGEVSSVQELLGANVNDKYFQNTAILSSSEDTTYNDDGDEIAEDSNEGTVEEKTFNIYDDLGNVILDITSNSEISNELVSKLSKDNSIENIKECIKGTDYIVNKYVYDQFLRPTETTEVSKKGVKTTENHYNDNGSITESKDEKGRITKTTFDSMNRAIKTELIVGNDTKESNISYSYGSINRNSGLKLELLENLSIITTTNKKGEIVGKTYTDAYGRIVREMSGGLFSDYTYDSSGKLFTTYVSGVNETNPDLVADGKLVVSTYDKKGRLTATISNPKIDGKLIKVGDDSIVTKNSYDNAGNQISSTDAMGNVTSYEYDNQGRISKVIESGDVKGTYKYDEFNKGGDGKYESIEESITYANGAISKIITNGADQVMSVADETVDGNIKTSYEYDKDGELIKEIYSDESFIKYEYDIDGNQTKAMTYSADNKLENMTEYTYDEEGQLIKTVDKKSDTPYRYTYYEYDDYGRNISVAEVNAGSTPSEDTIEKAKLKYFYNVDDVIEKVYYPNNSSDKLKGIKFNYNKDKWIVSIEGLLSGDKNSKIREYVYHNDGKVKTIRDYSNFLDKGSDCIEREYRYDVFDRVISIEYYNSSNADNILEKYNYKYDKNSHIIYKKEVFNYSNNKKDEETTYEYNNLNQLKKSEKKDNLTYKTTVSVYDYDKMGNRIYDGVTTRYTVANESETIEATYSHNVYNKLNQLISTTEIEATTVSSKTTTKTYLTSYKYDSRGNKIEEVDGKSGDTTTFTYDVENQLIDIVVKNNGQIKLKQHNEYNGTGQRIKKVDTVFSESGKKTETNNYYYEGSLLLYTTNELGEKTSQNIIGNANNSFATIRYSDGQSEYFYSKDIQGSTTNIVDKNGECCNSYNYTDFGETSERIDSLIKNEICYTGGVYDKTTELYYLNSRYYNSEDGVFLSQDTYRGEEDDAGSWNRYGYCEGDPINYTDPTGMWGKSIHQEITEKAYKKACKSLSKKAKKRLEKVGLDRLLKYCTYPDEARKTSGKCAHGSYHGHSKSNGKYYEVMSKALSNANKYYKKSKLKKCGKQLGLGLHTIQDFYAHNVKLKGKVVTSRRIANGYFGITDNDKLTLGDHPEYISSTFINAYEKRFGSIAEKIKDKRSKGKELTVHSITADNPYAYFSGSTWKLKKSKNSNPRYKKAVKACAKYLKYFGNRKVKSYQLNY